MAEAILVVKIDSEGNVQAIKQARQEIGATGEQSKKTGDSLAGLKKAAAFAAGAFAAIKSAQAAIDFVKMGAQVQAVEQRFVAFAGGAEKAQAYMEAFATATDGTVDRMGAMAGASKMLQMGLVDNADEMETMAAIAVKLGDQTMGASNRLADFSALLANRSIPRLDNFGISSGRVRERVQELTKAGYELDQAFKLAVLEEGRKSLEILGDTSELASTKIARIEASLTDLKTGLAVASVEVLDSTGILDRFAAGAGIIPETIERIGMMAKAYTSGVGTFVRTLSKREALDEFTNSLKRQTAAELELGSASEELRYKHITLMGGYDDAAMGAFRFRGEMEALEQTYGSSTEAQAQYSAAMQSTYEGMDKAAIAAAEYYREIDRQAEVLATSRAKLLDFGTAYTDFYQGITQEADDAAKRRDAIEERHQENLTRLKEKGTATLLAEEEERYAEELRMLAETQAAQEQAQQQSLGRMLLQHFEAWGQMRGLTIEQMTEMRLKISEDYGLIDAEGAQAARNQIRDWGLYFSMGAAGWADLDAKRQRFQDGVNALKGKTVDVRIRTIHETIGQESPGATIPELTRQHGGPAAGLVLVHGPELVQLPQGSYVYSPQQTRAMLAGAGTQARPYGPVASGMGGGGRGGDLHLHVTIMPNAVRSDEDIEQIMAGTERILNLRGAREYRI